MLVFLRAAVTEHVAFFGLEELFPGTGLEEIFNSDARFRTNIRRAMREDLFVPDDAASEKANAAISSLASSLMVNWKTSPTGYAALSGVFIDHGVENLSGESFIQTLGGLCGEESRGSLIDITGTGRRRERHSWHQDNGLERQFTCMLGFPPESDWEGVGVFSHSAKLSHPLRQDGKEGEIIEWEDFKVGDELPVCVIGRPVYSAGHEAGEEGRRAASSVVHSHTYCIRGDTVVFIAPLSTRQHHCLFQASLTTPLSDELCTPRVLCLQTVLFLCASKKSVSIEPINEFE